jgi:hypothetical protein
MIEKPEFVGAAPFRLEVKDAVIGHNAFETIGVAENPVGQVSAVAGSDGAFPVFYR